MDNNTKNKRTKIANILGIIYGIGIMVALFAGALSFVGYLIAIIIGGQTATDICVFIYKTLYPVLFVFSSCIVLLGLIKMYIVGEKSLSPKKKAKQDESRKKQIDIKENTEIAESKEDQPTEN